ncbi:hypothetical protein MRX96_016590 [Rhipicephalus microplus]
MPVKGSRGDNSQRSLQVVHAERTRRCFDSSQQLCGRRHVGLPSRHKCRGVGAHMSLTAYAPGASLLRRSHLGGMRTPFHDQRDP